MNTIDVRTEMRKFADSKPVHAAAGVGVLATETLRDLPARLAKWRNEATVTSLSTRATEYMTTARSRAMGEYGKARSRAMGEYGKARSRAMGEYDRLAKLGQRALSGPSRHAAPEVKAEMNGKTTPRKAAPHKTAAHKSAQSRTSHR